METIGKVWKSAKDQLKLQQEEARKVNYYYNYCTCIIIIISIIMMYDC